MANRPVLYLIDGHALAYRAFFALPVQAFSTRDGEPTNAVFGFTSKLMDVIQKERPRYLAVSFDKGLSGRDTVFEEYKGTREKMPEDMVPQMDRIYETVRAFNIPILELEGYEADDVIGTVAAQAGPMDIDIHIVTGDRDLLQLLNGHVRVQLPSRNADDQVFDVDAFIKKYSIRPDQLVDLKALMGDSSDNIPGVRGIGEKTGTSLLLKYGDLDTIYEHLDEHTKSVRNKLEKGKELAYISRELARIQRDLPIELNLKDCVSHDYDAQEVADLFRELEFKSLFDRLQNHDLNQLPLFSSGDTDNGDDQEIVETVIVDDADKLKSLVKTLNAAEAIVFDVETTSVDQMAATLVGIALGVDTETGYYVPVGHESGTQLPLDDVLDALRAPLTNPKIAKYAHNATYDLVVMQNYGIDVTPITFDSMIAEWVRDPISRFLGLKSFARQELFVEMTDIDELIGKGKNQRTMAEVSIKKAAPYAAADAAITMRAVEFLKERLAEIPNALSIVDTIEMPLVPVIAAMERAGVLLDVPFLREMSERLDAQIKELEATIYQQGQSGTFNINSPKQLNEVLFESLKLPVEGLKKTSHGYSTDVNTLEALRSEHEIIENILNYRELTKLKGTYVDALPELVNKRTGRVHTSYNQTGTSTGRFSSSNPNLQNIPIRTELGREVRRAFVAPDGYTLLAVDYSQIELRVMAHMSEDETLIQAFKEGQDIHQATAAAVFGIAPDDVSYEQRSFAKRVNFGLMYGMGEFRLARDSDLTLAESRDFIATYFKQLPGVEKYIERTKKHATEHGWVETLSGRRRYFPAIQSGRGGQAVAGELRAAINMPIQGTAADILKIAMIRLHEKLHDTDARMILQVHDEVVLEVPENQLDDVRALVVDTMETAYELIVPLVANASHGKNWLEMEDV